jgi:hypothetical protein
MERKKRNAEGKTSACQITSFISAMFYTIFTKKYTYQMLLSSKTKKSKLGNVLQFYVEIVNFIRNQVC